MDAFFYFLDKETKKKIIKIKTENPMTILKSLKEKMKKELDPSILYSKEVLERDKKLRKWISDTIKKK